MALWTRHSSKGTGRSAPLLAWLAISLLLAGCGGGGSGGSDAATSGPPASQQPPPPPPLPPPPTVADAEGLWSGTVLYRCDLWGVSALITREGWLFAGTPTGLFVGSLSQGSSPELTSVEYRGSGLATSVLDAQPNAGTITLSQANGGLDISWTGADESFCSPSSTNLRRDPLYERPASLAKISGVYTDGDLTLSVNSDGVVTGSDVNSCVFNGNVAVVHAEWNYYSATIDVDNCPGSGRLTGIAWLDDTEDGVQDHVLRLVTANAQHALWLWLQK